MTENSKTQKRLTGIVVSNKMKKTITVLVERKIKHAVYGKYIIKSTKYHAHNEDNIVKIGDLVSIEQCRPVSKLKSWKLVEIHNK